MEDPPPEVRGRSGRLYGKFSLCCLRPATWPRRPAIFLVESPLFDPVILITILANCVTMAWQSPLDPPGTWKAEFLDVCEWVFLAIFTFELTIKIVAYSLVTHDEAYLRDPWCQLDFVVVGLAWLPILFPTLGNYSALRAFRALRPLRALKRVPGMPVLVQWILSVLPKMGNVLSLCGFVLLVFGIVGMELFKGALHYRCALPGFVEDAAHPAHYRTRALKGGSSSQQLVSNDPQAPWDTGVACNPSDGAAAEQCPAGSTCAYFNESYENGLVSFDTIMVAYIALMECITCARGPPGRGPRAKAI